MLQPKLIHRPAQVIVGLKILTQPMSPEIPALWPRFMARVAEIAAPLEPCVSYGVMEMVGHHGDRGGLSYLAGVSVADPAAPIPEGMSAQTLPAGQYAVFEFPLAEVGAAFDFILNTWLPSSGFTQAATPLFERYGEDFDPAVPTSRMAAYVPVCA